MLQATSFACCSGLSGDLTDNGIFGGDGDDLIYGATVFGGGGRDLLVGGRGADTIFADADDTLSWADADGGVFIRLADNLAAVSYADGTSPIDSISGGRQFVLTQYDDFFEGSEAGERISPGLSRGRVVSGFQGNVVDVVDGKGGVDTVILDYSAGDGLTGLLGATMRFGTETVLERKLNTGVIDGVALRNIEQLTSRAVANATTCRASRERIRSAGGEGNDTLGGFGGGDTVEGNGGSDVLEGGNGNDFLVAYYSYADGERVGIAMNGGPGTDTAFVDLHRTTNPVLVSGGVVDTDDFVVVLTEIEEVQIFGGSSADLLRGGSGGDFLSGNGGKDRIEGMDGADILLGGSGEDILLGGSGDDQIFGGNDRDLVDAGAGNDLVLAGDGNDYITVGPGLDTVAGGNAVETIPGGASDGFLDELFYDGTTSASPVVLKNGTLNFKTLAGNSTTTFSGIEMFTIRGGKFNDTMNGGEGNDDFIGYAGKDSLTGGGGDDALSGGDGDDYLRGGEGDDDLIGGSGKDILIGDGGDFNTMRGGPENDTYFVDGLEDVIFELPKQGTDKVFVSIDGYHLPANFENLSLSGGAVTGFGNSAHNVITGTAAANIFYGGGGGDEFAGFDGDDLYVVENAKDKVEELLNAGRDTVEASVDYGLSAHVEALRLVGEAREGIGNELANSLTGNFFSNVLQGRDGRDVLVGGYTRGGWDGRGERDTLIGGQDIDLFVLGNGQHFYDDGAPGAGIDDFAYLKDFNPAVDKLQLDESPALFHLSPVVLKGGLIKTDGRSGGPNANGLFFDTNSDGSFDDGDELIAVFRGLDDFDLGAVIEHSPDV